MESTKKEKLYLASMLYLINKNREVNISKVIDLEDNMMDIIKEAEKLSLGKEPTGHSFNQKSSLLQSINCKQSDEFVHLFEKLSLTNCSFPLSKKNKNSCNNEVWNDFVEELKYIQSSSLIEFGESLLNLLFRYTCNLPADESALDISLYDHIKTTASIATCLSEYYEVESDGDTPFLLIGGDMSGIQSYIYEIVSKFAGKNLKGRSFYIRLLSDSIVRYLCKCIGLFQANIVYNSGGCFYILAPNTKKVKEYLTSSILTIEDNLFKEHGTKLYVAISSIEISKNALFNLQGESLPIKWKELFDKRDKKKKTRYAEKIGKEYQAFFEPSLIGGEAKIDAISGEEISNNETPYLNKELGDIKNDIGNIKQITGKQILLGKLLRETDVVIVSEKPVASLKKYEEFSPISLGVFYYFLKIADLDYIPELKCEGNGLTIITFNGNDNNNCDFAEKVKTSKCIKCLQFYGGNKYNQLTFEEMCDNDNFHRLGVLRMDVDSLGSIFQSGIPPELATLSRYSELSRSFDYFFSGYINTIQQKEEFKKKSFIIYSGGDDLFLVGDWSAMIQIAEQIREDFRLFTCGNTSFSVSGGIAIIPDKYPIMRGAQESDEEEKNAKEHSVNGIKKNSISFMGYALNWDFEFQTVKNLTFKIVDALKHEAIEKAFISKILSHHLSAKFDNHKITNIKTCWMMTYDLGRMKSRVKDKEAQKLIDNCRIECCTNKPTINGIKIESEYHPLELWAFAARWAELLTRSN